MKNLRLIEIELFSYCNRKCNWCPNKYIDRKSNIIYLDILTQLIQELKQNNYYNFISFSRYNEPMSQIDYFKKQLKYIKQELPLATLVTNTNGDFLNKKNLHNLYIDELSIMDYDNKGIEYCKNKLLLCDCIIDKIQNNFIYAHYNNMKIVYYTNWSKYYTPGRRGGFLPIEEPVRNYPCFEPLYFIGINYDGTVSPCCNVRNDIDKHKKYIYGNLNIQSLQEVLNNPLRLNFIQNCINNNFDIDSPCYKCTNNGGRYTKEKGGIEYE